MRPTCQGLPPIPPPSPTRQHLSIQLCCAESCVGALASHTPPAPADTPLLSHRRAATASARARETAGEGDATCDHVRAPASAAEGPPAGRSGRSRPNTTASKT